MKGYDSQSNLERMSALQHALFNVQTDVEILIAGVQATPTLSTRYGASAGTYLRQSKEENEARVRCCVARNIGMDRGMHSVHDGA